MYDSRELFLSADNSEYAKEIITECVEMGIDFKVNFPVNQKHLDVETGLSLVEEFPEDGKEINQIIEEFRNNILPYCTNFSSNKFMGFPDAGNSIK